LWCFFFSAPAPSSYNLFKARGPPLSKAIAGPVTTLLEELPTPSEPGVEVPADQILERFTAWASGQGLTLYPAQEEALFAVLAGDHVIVNTPTGSGKSLVALAAHFAALVGGKRSWYTAPIKALVSEKFFALCRELGSSNVGMLTGDASINPGAPVICCTAEVLANVALRYGAAAPVDQVVMDEFHFYGDPDRGWAWQVPLIELNQAQFVLMSATLGDVSRFVVDFGRRTGRTTTVVTSAQRPVPLDYRYARTLVHDTIAELVAQGLAPVYAVHFTQKAAVERAQALTSAQVTTRADRDRVSEALAGVRFAAGFGHTLSRLLRHGIGVHHAGMLPRYRRLVEKLCQEGLLKVVCGTDTLGVGINVPIRTVLFTALSKYDGTTSRLLSAREFHQMAGRAGRAGFDAAGSVVVQAPEHVSENDKALARAGTDAAKRRKVVKAKPPKGFVHWDESTFNRLVAAAPEPLTSNFRVTHAMLLEVLDRPGDGVAAMKHLLTDNDDQRPAQRRHIRQAIGMYRSLLAAGVLERLAHPDEQGRRVRVTIDLQEDFALNQPLSLFVLEALPHLESASPDWALDVVSVVEATLEGPWPVLGAQLERARTETLARLKEEGVEYENRMDLLREVEYPKPLAELLYGVFDVYRTRHPWARDHNVNPKSIVRDMYERAMGFSEYVAHYGIARSEGLLLRYFSDAYKALVQNVPEDTKSAELRDMSEWLGEIVRQVDSSLLDEWDLLSHPEEVGQRAARDQRTSSRPEERAPALSANPRALRVMARNAVFRRVELAARRDWRTLEELDQGVGWDAARWQAAWAPYFAEHAEIGTGGPARGPQLWSLEERAETWRARLVVDDPAQYHEWALRADIDLAASDEQGEPVVRPAGVERL
jgi:superfamily II RNA helicase